MTIICKLVDQIIESIVNPNKAAYVAIGLLKQDAKSGWSNEVNQQKW